MELKGIKTYRTEYTAEGLITLVKESEYAYGIDIQVNSPEKLVKVFNAVFNLESMSEEYFCMIAVNTKGLVIGAFRVSQGDLTSTIIHPREVFKRALLCNAAAVAFSHNHPSGDTVPSSDDIATTDKLVEAGKILGIAVWDHVIIGSNGFASLREQGLIA